jgi:hypothetical protein
VLSLDLQKPFVKALGQLRSDSYALVNLPTAGKAQARGLLDDIAKVPDDQITDYGSSLARYECRRLQQRSPHFVQLLERCNQDFAVTNQLE